MAILFLYYFFLTSLLHLSVLPFLFTYILLSFFAAFLLLRPPFAPYYLP